MKYIREYLLMLFSAVKPALIAAACALVLVANTAPAIAFGGSQSQPSDGLEQLDNVQKKSEKALSSRAENVMDDTENVIKNSQEGLNGVQGSASKNDMNRPSEVRNNTIEGNIKETLEEITQ
ncbi:MAG: hypothetical protein AAFP20_18645 [Cyanobacteria bacterium J06614_10]